MPANADVVVVEVADDVDEVVVTGVVVVAAVKNCDDVTDVLLLEADPHDVTARTIPTAGAQVQTLGMRGEITRVSLSRNTELLSGIDDSGSMCRMAQIRQGTLLWPSDSPMNPYAIRAAAEAEANASVDEDEWVDDVQVGTGHPQKGNDSVMVFPYSYQVAKHGGSIAARPR